MDISVHIGELLFEHDCVIIPGFGGFIGNYKPAVIDAQRHTIYPPSKALSFNKHLQSNDGLLVNHIARKKGIPFDVATELVEAWVSTSNGLLESEQELTVNHIGRIYKDVEGKLQFEPGTSVNYLKESYGLRTITAVPVVKEKPLDIQRRKRRYRIFSPGAYRFAASVLIIISIVLLSQLMFKGIQIKQLNLDQAGMVSFVNSIFKTDEYKLRPIPVETEKMLSDIPDDTLTDFATLPESPLTQPLVTRPAPVEHTPVPVEAKPAPAVNTGNETGYYIIIGAFKDDNNAAKAKARLLQRFPGQNILFEKRSTLTKVGYFAGNDAAAAREQLYSAQAEDSSYWLMKK